MAEKSVNEEVSIITHLLEVEKQASQIITVAGIKGDKMISDAKIAADSQFKKLYQEKSEKLQNDFDQKKSQIELEYNKVMDEYKESVYKQKQDKEKFNSVMNSLLFE